MNKTQWEDLIGKIDPVYIEEAEQWTKAAQKKTRRRHFVSMAACICILLITAVASFDLFFPKKEAPAEMAANPESAADTDQTILNEAAPASEQTDKNGTAAIPELSKEKDSSTSNQVQEKDDVSTSGQTAVSESASASEQININEINSLKCLAIDINIDHDADLSGNEMEEYYGVKIFPESLPADLADESLTGKLYYNDKNQVIADNNVFEYRAPDGKKYLQIGVRTIESGEIIQFADDGLAASVINGIYVTIAKITDEKQECYTAVFEKDNVKFTIQTKSLTLDELLSILRELC